MIIVMLAICFAQEPDWTIPSDELSSSSEDDKVVVDQYWCVACDKTFKTQKAMENHERCVASAMKNHMLICKYSLCDHQ